MIEIGQIAPDFELPAHDGTSVRLSERLEQGAVVLYFYPADFTPVCTAQACMVRDAHEKLMASGYQVLGVSPQSAESHEKFDAKHGLGFTLLADTDKSVIKAYGASAAFGLLTRRVTYLIGQDGVVKDRAVGDLSVKKHRSLIERAMTPR